MTIHLYDDDFTYTTDALIELLKIELSKFIDVEKKEAESRKYYNQAFHMLKIGAYSPSPYFTIQIGDLTEKLRKELSELDRETRNYVLKQAVGRIFEDINSSIFHKSVSKVLKVRFEK